MTAQILDGKKIARDLRQSLTAEIAAARVKPGLAVILVGDDPASHIYVRNKIKACQEVGIESYEHRMDANASQIEVRHAIKNLNANRDIHGILLQLPLPVHLDADTLIQTIDPAKDVDGLTFVNIGKLAAGADGLVPCTPQGALLLIKAARKDLSGLHIIVIGRSLLFGKPMAQLMLAENCTVTIAHSKTKNLPELCRQADILIAAVGRAEMVRGDWIKPGAIIIDVGINWTSDGTLKGDVAFDEAAENAAAITPVPGGVGPMTIACLLKNTLKAARDSSRS